MTDRAALLDYADHLLEGKVALGSRGARTAALLARRAVEDWLDEQSAAWSGSSYSQPSTRSKLVVLGTLRGVELGEQAKRVWHGLSVACHHHSYELQPSAAEVSHLVQQVRKLDTAENSE
jgi:hypothetical protein